MKFQSIDNKILPPSPFVRHFAEMLNYGPLNVLDVGCCEGRNAVYLAKLGHKVTALSLDIEDLINIQKQPELDLRFIAADARHLPLRGLFDVVLMNEVLHQIPKTENRLVLDSLKRQIKPGGFHVISDYIGSKANALQSRELYEVYANSAWEIIEYHEDEPSSVRYGEIEELTSRASIIAARK